MGMISASSHSWTSVASEAGSGWINSFMFLTLRSLVFPSWSCIRTTLPFFCTTFYGNVSKLGQSLFSLLLLSKMWSPSPISLYCADRLRSAYSFSRSFPRASLSRRSCSQWPSMILFLRMVTIGSLSLRGRPMKSSAGTIRTPYEVWFDTGRGNFPMPFSSLYLLKWQSLLSLVKSRYRARLHHYSAASREFL